MLGVFVCGFRPRCPTQWLRSSTAMKRTLGGLAAAANPWPAVEPTHTQSTQRQNCLHIRGILSANGLLGKRRLDAAFLAGNAAVRALITQDSSVNQAHATRSSVPARYSGSLDARS